METTVAEPQGRKPLAPAVTWKTKFLTSPHPRDRGFDFQSAPQKEQQTFEVSAHSGFPLFVSSWQCVCRWEISARGLVSVPPFSLSPQHLCRRSRGFRNALSSQCFAFNSKEKYWVYYSGVGSRSMSLVLHCPTHKDTQKHARFLVVPFRWLPRPPSCWSE